LGSAVFSSFFELSVACPYHPRQLCLSILVIRSIVTILPNVARNLSPRITRDKPCYFAVFHGTLFLHFVMSCQSLACIRVSLCQRRDVVYCATRMLYLYIESVQLFSNTTLIHTKSLTPHYSTSSLMHCVVARHTANV
jgi:hypothetical protein